MEVRETVDQIVGDSSHPEVVMIWSSVAVKAEVVLSYQLCVRSRTLYSGILGDNCVEWWSTLCC